MSKLFEALKRTAEANKEILAIVESGHLSAGTDAPRAESPDAPSPEPEAAAAGPFPAAAPDYTAEPQYRVEHLRLSASAPTLPFDGSESRAAEQYRLIRTRLLHHPAEPRMLLVSSPTPGDGKTITAINLAAAMALKGGNKVLLLDGDLRRPGIARILGIPSDPGLGAVLDGTSSLERAIVSIAELPGLRVLPAGKTSVNPTELLDSAMWADLRTWIRLHFHYMVIDSPPVSTVADYELLEKSADGVIIIIRPDHTNRRLTFKVLESIPREKQLGVIVNCASEWALLRHGNPYSYYGEYQ